VEFVGERLKYILLSGCRLDIIFLNEHAQPEVKGDDSKDSFCDEFEQAFDHLNKYHVKILLGVFNKKLMRENIFKPIIGSSSSKYSNNNNGVRVVNFATSNTMVVKIMLFPHRNFINTPGPNLMSRIQWRLVGLS
jgi:hypothetical protein